MNSMQETVRVFISSTFRDMHAERDHLVSVVFPELRERAEQLGLDFFDVDLRWGVPAKDLNGETANSWEYCRQWIDRVEPFFVCILGQRYGWVPEPHHFRDDADRRRQEREPRSITDLEVRHAVLDTRRKRRSYFYLRATSVPEPNAEYVDTPEYLGRLEQLRAAVRHCGRPVRDYSPEWTGHGFAGLKEFGDLVFDDLWSGVLRDERYVSKAVWRQVLKADPDTDPRFSDESQPVPRELWEQLVALAKPPPQDPLDAERQQMEAFATSRLRWFQGRTRELQQLTDFIHSTAENAPCLAVVAAAPGQGKSALIAKLSNLLSQSSIVHVTHFAGATPSSTSLREMLRRLCEEVYSQYGLKELMQKKLAAFVDKPDDSDEQRETKREQRESVEKEFEIKQDIQELSNQFREFLKKVAPECRIVILLDALNQLADGHDLHWLPTRLGPSVRIIVSCADTPLTPLGGHPLSSDGRRAGGEGINQTRSSGRESAPSAARESQSRLTSAATPEQQVLGALERWEDSSLRVPLGPLTEDDVRTIVVEYLEEYCKELDPEQVDAICHMGQAKNPLYLLVMLGELRTLGGNAMNEKVPKLIADLPKEHPDTVSLFRWVLQRLEVFDENAPDAVKWWCLYLAHGRVGMASHELADLLARKLGAEAKATALMIERGLRRYLQRRGGQLDFFHSQLRQAVLEQYRGAASCEDANAQSLQACIHQELADYFTGCAKGTDPRNEWETDSVRGFGECVFHFIKAKRYDHAERQLTCFAFLLHKLRAGLLEGVLEDYEMVQVERDHPTCRISGNLDICSAFFREKAHILRRGSAEWPAHKILLQLAVEHADASPLTVAAERWLAENRSDWLWLRRVPRPSHAQKSSCMAVLEGHTSAVRGVIDLNEGQLLSWSGDGTMRLWESSNGRCLAVLRASSEEFDRGSSFPVSGVRRVSGDRFLSWSEDWTLHLWDGQSLACLAVLAGHTGTVCGVRVLADGRLLSWSNDKTLRLWDGQSGACLAVLEGHAAEIRDALALADGRLLSWSDDKTLRLWDGQSGACLAVLEGHAAEIRDALSLADGRLLTWSDDKTLRLWDGQSGACLAVLEGHTAGIRGVLALADGRLLSWAGPSDLTLRLWDGQSGACVAVLEGHTAWISGLLALADGRLLSWSDDKTLRLWDEQSGACLAVLEGHTAEIIDALELADGRLLSWAGSWNSLDPTLRLWDGQSGECLAMLAGHTGTVKGVRVLADGRLLSWAADNTLRIWNREGNAAPRRHPGHTCAARGALALTNGRVLSWSNDQTLRLWDAQTGERLQILEGHTGGIAGALALEDGLLVVSWSWDRTLRVWDCQTGVCLAVLKGHTDDVEGAMDDGNGRLVSWSRDGTFRWWFGPTGECIHVFPEDEVAKLHPNWIQAKKRIPERCNIIRGFTMRTGKAVSFLFHQAMGRNVKSDVFIIALWHADSASTTPSIMTDGTAVVPQSSGQVCILKLYHGNRRVSFTEAEALLPEG